LYVTSSTTETNENEGKKKSNDRKVRTHTHKAVEEDRQVFLLEAKGVESDKDEEEKALTSVLTPYVTNLLTEPIVMTSGITVT
jgi:hypothetical protein